MNLDLNRQIVAEAESETLIAAVTMILKELAERKEVMALVFDNAISVLGVQPTPEAKSAYIRRLDAFIRDEFAQIYNAN